MPGIAVRRAGTDFAHVPGEVSVPPAALNQIEDLIRGVLVLARGRGGRVAALTLSVDAELPVDEVRAAVERRLSLLGFPDVDVQVRVSSGAPRLLSVEYAR